MARSTIGNPLKELASKHIFLMTLNPMKQLKTNLHCENWKTNKITVAHNQDNAYFTPY